MRSLFLTFLVIVATSFIANGAYGCTCGGNTELLTQVAEKPIVLRATVISLDSPLRVSDNAYAGITVRLNSVLKGAVDSEELVLLGGDGMSCTDILNSGFLKVGSEYLFALSVNSIQQYLSPCSTNYALIEDESVAIVINEGDRYMLVQKSIEEITNIISNNN